VDIYRNFSALMNRAVNYFLEMVALFAITFHLFAVIYVVFVALSLYGQNTNYKTSYLVTTFGMKVNSIKFNPFEHKNVAIKS